MSVQRLLPTTRKRLATIQDNAPLMEAARLLLDLHTDLVVVCSSDKLLAGVITKTDLVRQMSRNHLPGAATTASTAMTRTVIFCRPHDSLHSVWSTMKGRHLKNIPVVDQLSRPMGVLNARDALEVLLAEAESEDVLLRDYVMGVGYR